jgi:hypothetical protein
MYRCTSPNTNKYGAQKDDFNGPGFRPASRRPGLLARLNVCCVPVKLSGATVEEATLAALFGEFRWLRAASSKGSPCIRGLRRSVHNDRASGASWEYLAYQI